MQVLMQVIATYWVVWLFVEIIYHLGGGDSWKLFIGLGRICLMLLLVIAGIWWIW